MYFKYSGIKLEIWHASVVSDTQQAEWEDLGSLELGQAWATSETPISKSEIKDTSRLQVSGEKDKRHRWD